MFPVSTLFILNLSSTLLMTGVIWVVQLVHYPSFRFVDKVNFTKFESFHGLQISKVVIPLMLIELVSSALIIYGLPKFKWVLGVSFCLLLGIWLVTFLLSSPYHQLLLSGYDENIVSKLIQTNWIRTALWTVRSFLILYICSLLLRGLN